MTKEATSRKIQIQISVDTDESTVTTLLRKIDPMLCYQLSLANKVKLVDTLKEVKMQEPDIQFLAARADRVRGMVITHIHQDHLGAVVDVWPLLRCVG